MRPRGSSPSLHDPVPSAGPRQNGRSSAPHRSVARPRRHHIRRGSTHALPSRHVRREDSAATAPIQTPFVHVTRSVTRLCGTHAIAPFGPDQRGAAPPLRSLRAGPSPATGAPSGARSRSRCEALPERGLRRAPRRHVRRAPRSAGRAHRRRSSHRRRGLQSHVFFPDALLNPVVLRPHLYALEVLGLMVELTKLEIPLRPGLSHEGALTQPSKASSDGVSACASEPISQRITRRGLGDRYT